MEYVECNLCKKNSSELIFKAKDLVNPEADIFDLVCCKNCGLIYTNPRPKTEEIPHYYPQEDYYSFSELEKNKTGKLNIFEKIKSFMRETVWNYFYNMHASQAKKILQYPLVQIAKHRYGSAPPQISPGKILDVGCGDGLFLNALQKMGWQVCGVEISKRACDIANKYHLNVFNGSLLEAGFKDNCFDVVRMWSVLEHMSDPLAYLIEAKRILKKDGILIAQVPNFSSLAAKIFGSNWTAVDVPRHFYHFNPQTFRAIINKAGFKIMKFEY